MLACLSLPPVIQGALIRFDAQRLRSDDVHDMHCSWGPGEWIWDGATAVVVEWVLQDGSLYLVDEHEPPPACRITAANELTYTIPVWLPPVSKDTVVRLVMHPTGTPLVTAGTVIVTPPNLAPKGSAGPKTELISGWYGLERDAGGRIWRWMAGVSELTLANPFRPAVLYLKGWLPLDRTTERSGLHVEVNGHEIDYLQPRTGRFAVRYELPPWLMGDGDLVHLTLRVDKTFQPGAGDTRELGMMLHQLFFQ